MEKGHRRLARQYFGGALAMTLFALGAHFTGVERGPSFETTFATFAFGVAAVVFAALLTRTLIRRR